MRRLSRRALGRTAATRRDRAVAGDAPGGDAVRRGHRRAGSRNRQGSVEYDPGARPRGHDLHSGHARDALRTRARRSSAVHRRGLDRRSGSAGRALRSAAKGTHARVPVADPVKRYSILSLIGGAFTGHSNWPRAWRNPALKKRYDAVVIGGGGHGLATAYYLA